VCGRAVPLEVAGCESEEISLIRRGDDPFSEEFLSSCEQRLRYFAVPRYLEVLPERPRTPTNRFRSMCFGARE
jgi:hypothetical protein